MSFYFFYFPLSAQLYIGGEFNYPFYASDLNISEIYYNSETRSRYSNPNLKPGGRQNFSANIGYSITSYIRIETEVELYETVISWENEYIKTGSPTYDELIHFEKQYEGLFLRPGVVLSMDNRKAFVPYVKVGAIIAKMDQQQEYLSSQSYYTGENNYETQTRKYSYEVQYGMTSTFGFEIKFSKIFVPYFEVKADFISVSPHSSSLISWYNNGENLLSTATLKEREIEFVESFDANDLTDHNKNKSLVFYEPFSRVSGNAGIRIYLWKKKQKQIDDGSTIMNGL